MQRNHHIAQTGLPYRLWNGSLWSAFSRVAEPSGGRLLDYIHFNGSTLVASEASYDFKDHVGVVL